MRENPEKETNIEKGEKVIFEFTKCKKKNSDFPNTGESHTIAMQIEKLFYLKLFY